MATENTPLVLVPDPSIERYMPTEDDDRNFNAGKSGDIGILPRLQRSKTFSVVPRRHNSDAGAAIPISVANPVTLERRLSAFPGVGGDLDLHELSNRVDSLKALRPFRLIGNVSRLVNWEKRKIDVSKVKSKALKSFYEQQNDMIERYQDIDLLLDTGIQIEMIQNYADNTSTEEFDDYEEAEEGDDNSDVNNSNPSTALGVPMQKNGTEETRLTTSTRRRNRAHVNVSATPGNIDLEGARILGVGDHGQSNTVLYALYLNFALNVVLLFGKVIVVYMSNSLSLVASLVDSALDFLSTLIIFVANRYASRKSAQFPVGRQQLEPIGVMIFSVVMILSFAQVLIESIKQLINPPSPSHDGDVVMLTPTAVYIMIATLASKITAWVLCKNVENSSIQALVEDAKTDVVFNTFSLIFPLVGNFLHFWWVDAAGASALCLYVMVQWITVTFEHINHLSGSSAPKEQYQQVLYLILRFTDEVAKVKNYRTYHMGDLLNVEVDVVLRNPTLSLKDAHDLGESLQYSIETLPYVGRCFVHMDYKVRNYAGHIVA